MRYTLTPAAMPATFPSGTYSLAVSPPSPNTLRSLLAGCLVLLGLVPVPGFECGCSERRWGVCFVLCRIQYSASGIWKQSDWMAAATMSTIPVRQAQAVLFLTYARKLGSTATLASQILIRQSDHWSRVKVGGEMVMPHSKSRMQFSYDTQGTMQTVWERRLLSNVRLQVTGELNLFSFKQTNPQSPAFYGNRFGLCLHIG